MDERGVFFSPKQTLRTHYSPKQTLRTHYSPKRTLRTHYRPKQTWLAPNSWACALVDLLTCWLVDLQTLRQKMCI